MSDVSEFTLEDLDSQHAAVLPNRELMKVKVKLKKTKVLPGLLGGVVTNGLNISL